MMNEMNKFNSDCNIHLELLGTPQYPNRDIMIRAISAQIISLIFSRVENRLGVDFTCFNLIEQVNIIPDDEEIYRIIKLSHVKMATIYVYAYVFLLKMVKHTHIQLTANNWLLLYLSCVSLAKVSFTKFENMKFIHFFLYLTIEKI